MSGKKRKGLSADEKRDAILHIYHTQMEPFNLKEIESLASKAGVVQQTVKEHNQSLVDDSLVMSDKIGSSVFFWSFPSQRLHERTVALEALTQQIEAREEELRVQEERVAVLARDRCAPNRAELLEKIKALTDEEKSLDIELDKYKSNDPAIMKVYREQCAVNRAGVERWTDNIWQLKSYLTKKRGLPGKEVDQLLGINSTFEDTSFKQQKNGKKRKF